MARYNKPDQPVQPAAQRHYRYPGPESFRDDDTDCRVFFGRDEEITEVLNRVLSSKLLVLFAKSGLGKTSLLQAGLFPRLRERDLLPIRLRFNWRDSKLMDELRLSVEATCKAKQIAYTHGVGDTLWEYFNTVLFSLGDRFLAPVLVLDQFEEIFTLHKPEFRQSLALELGHLVTGTLPPSVRQRIRDGAKLDYPAVAPSVRLVLSLREEYVGSLQELALAVPGILDHRYRLLPLDSAHARLAIEKPAHLEDADGRFATRPFQYSAEILEAMLKFLASNHGEIEPFQLQILCRHVEQQVATRQSADDTRLTVDMQDYFAGTDGIIAIKLRAMTCCHRECKARLAWIYKMFGVLQGRPCTPSELNIMAAMEGMGKVIRQFYLHALSKLNRRVRRKAQRLCEQGLLSPEGYRESLGQGQILRSYGLKDKTLDELVEAKILRREDKLDKFSYELSHDSLAGVVYQHRQSRVRTVRLASMSVLVLAISMAGWQWWSANVANNKADVAQTTAQAYLQDYARSVKELVDHDPKLIKQPAMVNIPAGRFWMGSPDRDNQAQTDEKPAHQVTLKAFMIGRYEVSFEEYDQFAASTGRPLPDDAGWGRGKQPVIYVSWDDAVAYAAWLSGKTGKNYRLPTEAEWEYAARGGTSSRYWWGEDIGQGHANCNGCGSQWDNKQTAPVGSFPANPFGLFDTAGNVWEWVQDCFHPNYLAAPVAGNSAWQTEQSGDCTRRGIRGGSWYFDPDNLRSAFRSRYITDYRLSNLGFRLAQDL